MEAFLKRATGLLVEEYGFSILGREKPNGADGGPARGGKDWGELFASIHAGRDLHDSTTVLAARFVRGGLGGSAAVNAVRGVLEASTAPRDERWQERFDDIPRAVSSAEGKFGDGKAQTLTEAMSTVSAASFAGKPVPAREYLVNGLIPADIVFTLNGDGSVGKSLIALQLGVAMASRTTWLGLQVCGAGRCLFVTAEDEIEECHRRIAAISAAEGIDLANLGDLMIISLAGEDALLAVPNREKILCTTDMFARLEKTIETTKPKLAILDTLADMFGGDEINRAQARQFITMLRGLAMRHRTTIMLLAHPSLAGMASGTGSSGSTGWNNSVRHRQYLTRVLSADGKEIIEPDLDARVLKTVKNNYGRNGSEIRLRWEDGRFVRIDEPCSSGLDFVTKQVHAERVFLDLLAAYEDEGRNVCSTPSVTYAPAVFIKDDRSNGLSKRALADAMNRLFKQKRIQTIEFGSPSRLRKRIKITEQEDKS